MGRRIRNGSSVKELTNPKAAVVSAPSKSTAVEIGEVDPKAEELLGKLQAAMLAFNNSELTKKDFRRLPAFRKAKAYVKGVFDNSQLEGLKQYLVKYRDTANGK